jgi:beta-xylosidase
MKVINFSALACAALVSAQAIAAGPSYRNPAIFADCPDVSLCCDGKYYYMVSTTMHMVPGAPVMRSKDMLRWEMVGYVFDRFDFAPEFSFEDPNGKTAYSGGQWASSFKYHKGKFYCYFISNGHGGFLYTADKAEGPWKLHSREPFMHDASLLFDDDGKVWVFHGDGWLTLTIAARNGEYEGMLKDRAFTVVLPDGATRRVVYAGKEVNIKF